MGKKLQSGFEMLLIFGIGIAILTPAFIYAMTARINYSDTYGTSAAQNVVNKIAEAADSIYLQGEPSRIVLNLYFPEKISETSIADKTIMIKLSISPGITDIYQTTDEDVSGTLPTTSGIHKVTIENKGDYISISYT